MDSKDKFVVRKIETKEKIRKKKKNWKKKGNQSFVSDVKKHDLQFNLEHIVKIRGERLFKCDLVSDHFNIIR